MKKVYEWFRKLPKQIRDSVVFSMTVVGFISTFFTVLGISLERIPNTTIWGRIGIVIFCAIILAVVYYWTIGSIYKDSVTFNISQTLVEISCGDIFQISGLKVIGCDTHFDTRIDDEIIARNSLHGQLVLEHGNSSEIRKIVEDAAYKLGLEKNAEGLFDFPLGTIIKYHSSVDGQIYLLLALAELDKQYKVHTNMAKYELMLMKMWKEIDRVYASNDIVLPILGSGILRFDDGPKNKEALLRCMICTLNSSAVRFNSKVKIVLYGKHNEISLYEYKDLFNIISR